MSNMLQLYFWNLVCGVVNAAALTLYGAHLAARGRAVQCLAIGQAATLGVLFGAWLFHEASQREWAHWFCPLSGFIFASIVFVLSESLLRHRKSSRSSILIALFALLLASTHLLVTILPGLEAHMSQAFFGDLVTVGGTELWLSTALAAFSILIYFCFHRRFSDQSFSIAIFGHSLRSPAVERVFRVTALAVITGSIFALGLLFTLSMLFVPTTVLSFSHRASLVRHLLFVALMGIFATCLGLVASLHIDRLPTVPTIVLVIGVGGFFCLVLEKSYSHFQRR